MKLGLTSFLLLFSIVSFGQLNVSAVDINLIKSDNNEFSLISAPYTNHVTTQLGKTVVRDIQNNVHYVIPRYFSLIDRERYLFIDNSGEYVVYIVSHNIFHRPLVEKSIQIFRNGRKFHSYDLNELTDDSIAKKNKLFFDDVIDSIGFGKHFYAKNTSELKKKVFMNPVLSNDRKVLIFAQGYKVIELNLKDGKIKSYPLQDLKLQELNSYNKPISNSINHHVIYPKNLIVKGTNKHIYDALADLLNLKLTSRLGSDLFIQYGSEISFLIDRNGNCSEIEINANKRISEDSVRMFFENCNIDFSYREQSAIEKKFTNHIKFVNNATLDDTVDKWQVTIYPSFTEKDLQLSKKLKHKEIQDQLAISKKNLVADSIYGIYIPKNIEDCFHTLNNIMKKEDIDKIKNIKSNNDLSAYHFGIGLWMRNNWGLWVGSRLSEYFHSRNINHPDSISSRILSFYHEWLNDKNSAWEKFHILEK